jgi:hypothetical protein
MSTQTQEQHLDNLLRHIELVREAGILLGKRLMAQGRPDFGRLLIARAHEHDNSKFFGVEWEFLHRPKGTVPDEDLRRAIKQHQNTNRHHPEYHGGFDKMDEIDVAEFVCDVYARSTEFGTSVRDWINTKAVERYKIDTDGDRYRWLQAFLKLLLDEPFS